MLFDTPIYIIFLTFIVVIYWRFKWRQQNILLLLASYFFYGWWDWRFLSLILISTVVDYFCAHYIVRSDNHVKRKALLAISVTLNLSFLGFFKYFNFFVDSFADLMGVLGLPVSKSTLNIILPPGISFYTFQALAYIVDVYYNRLKPATRIVDYALFINLFPHLIAGPIQRPSHLLPQVQKPRVFLIDKFRDGLMLIAFGLFQKCVIADNCSLLADAAFGGKLGEPNLAVLAIGTYAFAWQIYGDFSGYSNIARGSAQLLGFHFMVNFRQPYLATSLQDFWRRWHISLSTWLRDYLYISLGGNRGGTARTYRNLMLTMVIGGFWHGANWTFVIWGYIHGVVLCIERFAHNLFGIEKRNPKPKESSGRNSLLDPASWMKRLVIFHVVCFSWIFFRATSTGDAFGLLSGLFHFQWIPEYSTALLFLIVFSLPLFIIDILIEHRGEEYLFEKSHPYLSAAVALGLLAAIILFAGSKANAFIYFQF
jgi:alginate O-acetyltransferase complex protein AlgI